MSDEAIKRVLAALETQGGQTTLGALDDASRDSIRALTDAWTWRAHPGQLAPPGEWQTWLLMAGRGFGKTLAGAQWVHSQARILPRGRFALVGSTYDDARRVMIEGASGLAATASPDPAPKWNRSKGELTFASGAQAFVYSAISPEALRGPEHHLAWCDELGKWGRGSEDVWDNLMMGLRLGASPRVLVTTTPRATPLLRRIRASPGTVEVGGRTAENRHLPASYIANSYATYGGTRKGREELEGEMLDDAEHTLFTRASLEGARIDPVRPEDITSEAWPRLVIAVDPAVTSTGDACGIVLCGLRADGMICVLADASVVFPSPDRWANAVIACYRRWPVDRIVVENNQGGDLVTKLLTDIDRYIPVSGVHASKGKIARAEPVSALFERKGVKMAGSFPELEDQLNGLVLNGAYAGPGRSPDRADAMVYAVNALMAGISQPAIRSLG